MAGLVVALQPGAPLWLTGAAEVRVHGGAVELLGARLTADSGPLQLVNAPYDSIPAIRCVSLSGAADACLARPAFRALVARGAAPGGATGAVIELRPIAGLEGFLDDYDCKTAGMPCEVESFAVRGCCVLRRMPGGAAVVAGGSGSSTAAPVWAAVAAPVDAHPPIATNAGAATVGGVKRKRQAASAAGGGPGALEDADEDADDGGAARGNDFDAAATATGEAEDSDESGDGAVSGDASDAIVVDADDDHDGETADDAGSSAAAAAAAETTAADAAVVSIEDAEDEDEQGDADHHHDEDEAGGEDVETGSDADGDTDGDAVGATAETPAAAARGKPGRLQLAGLSTRQRKRLLLARRLQRQQQQRGGKRALAAAARGRRGMVDADDDEEGAATDTSDSVVSSAASDDDDEEADAAAAALAAAVAASAGSTGSGSCRIVDTPLTLPAAWSLAIDGIICGRSADAAGCTGAGTGGDASGGGVVPTVVVVGPKGSGKSTLVRHLCNGMLTGLPPAGAPGGGVAYLDLDLGQPEHTVPGCVSLSVVRAPITSPPHARTHHHAMAATPAAASVVTGDDGDAVRHRVGPVAPIASVVACRWLGSTSPKNDPGAYTHAVLALVRHYQVQLAPRGLPLVVNAHGWTKGIGFETTQAVIDAVAPTHLLVLEAEEGELAAAAAAAADGDEDDVVVDPDAGGVDDHEPGAATAAAASSASAPVHRRRAAATTEVFLPPPVPWQHAAAAGYTGQQPVRLVLPAWHAVTTRAAADVSASDSGRGAGAAAAASAGGKSLPPRAVRSPAELRSARIMSYLAAGLHAAPPGGANANADTISDRVSSGGGVAVLQRLMDACFGLLMAEHRIARAPVAGIGSPAFAFALAVPLLVPFAEVAIARDASQSVRWPALTVAGTEDEAASPPCWLAGQLVGLCSAAAAAAAAAANDGAVGAAPAAWLPVASLPCLGVAFVRHVDPLSGLLHLVTPVPLAVVSGCDGAAACGGACTCRGADIASTGGDGVAACVGAGVDTLVCWDGVNDVPLQLLYRDAPLGDRWCVAAASVGSVAVGGTAKTGENRKNLGRKGLGGGK